MSLQVHQPLADRSRAHLTLPGLTVVAPQRGAQPGQQLGHGERLGHVVVGPGVQCADLVAGAAPARQHDDRCLGPPAQLDDDLGAVDVGQAQIQDDRVGRVAQGHRERLPPGPRGQHVVLPGPQVDAQRPEQFGLILDDEDPVRVGPAGTWGAGSARGFRPGVARLCHHEGQPDLADSSSSLMLRVSTLTVGSPRKPSVRPVMFCVTRLRTSDTGRCLAAATRSTWMYAFAGVMSGSRPEPDAVTASGGICDTDTWSNAEISCCSVWMSLISTGLVGPRLLAAE